MRIIQTTLVIGLLSLLGGCASFYHISGEEDSGDCVVLIHGLWGSSTYFEPLARELKKRGFCPILVDYPSTLKPLDQLAEELFIRIAETVGGRETHFVTHSMGGLLLRQGYSEKLFPNLGHIIMLGPPNRGSEVADRMKSHAGARWLIGPSGSNLGTGPEDWPLRLPEGHLSPGIIAGTKSASREFSQWLPGPDDGLVSVSSCEIQGMTELITLPVPHVTMMQDPTVIRKVIQYLESGSFSPRHLT